MTKELLKVNEWAKMSCSNWNNDRFTREVYRDKYKAAAEAYWNSQRHQALITKYKNGDHGIDTYPWPYCDEEFANWPENSDADRYSLITDQSNCIVKHSTSYCAWKIFETTGKWPQKFSREKFNAGRWAEFLAEAGYTKILKPGEMPEMFRNYVGVKSNEDGSGLVVWVEFASEPDEHWVTVSSYVNKKYKIWVADADDFRWVLIR